MGSRPGNVNPKCMAKIISRCCYAPWRRNNYFLVTLFTLPVTFISLVLRSVYNKSYEFPCCKKNILFIISWKLYKLLSCELCVTYRQFSLKLVNQQQKDKNSGCYTKCYNKENKMAMIAEYTILVSSVFYTNLIKYIHYYFKYFYYSYCILLQDSKYYCYYYLMCHDNFFYY